MKTWGKFAKTVVLFSLVGVFGLSGCTTVQPTPSNSVLKDDFQAEVAVEVALRVLETDYSLEQLQSRGTSEIEIFEPFDQADTEFTVISFGQLLLDSGLEESDQIVTIALNDYRFTDSVENFVRKGALLALLENGQPIPISEGGPVRIVFTEDSEYYKFLDAWNWSLASIEISGE